MTADMYTIVLLQTDNEPPGRYELSGKEIR